MSDLDRHLHHASRRLREMTVDVPPLATLGIDDAPAQRRPPQRRATTRVPACLAVALIFVGGMVGFTIGRTNSAIPAVEYAAPGPADRMRDPLLRLAAPDSPADEIAAVPSTATMPRLQVRW